MGRRHIEESDEQLVRPLCNIVKNALPLEPVWGNWLFKNSVVFQVGEPGMAKTTFNYALAKALVDGAPFLGVIPKGRYKVLYGDWESGDSLIAGRVLGGTGLPEAADDLMVYNSPLYTLEDVEEVFDRVYNNVFKFDVLVIDCLRFAFNTRDESDNAEASRQMKYVRWLSQKWNCTTILIHHSQKAELEGTRKASGAFARAGLIDIQWNFEYISDRPERRNIFLFSMPKNRLIDDPDFKIFLEKREGDFIVSQQPSWYDATNHYESPVVRYTIQEMVLERLSKYKPKDVNDIWTEMGKDKTCSRQSIHKALFNLMVLRRAEKTLDSKYILTDILTG